MIKQPMFSPRENPAKYLKYFEELVFPLYCSPKLDGIRCLPLVASRTEYNADLEPISSSEYPICKSRTMTDIPSKQVQREFSPFIDLDGELIEGNETDFDVCNRTQSYVMSVDKEAPDLKFRVFDCCAADKANVDFEIRLAIASAMINKYKLQYPNANVSLIEHVFVDDLNQMLEFEEYQLSLGYEGIMWRSPWGPYKHGRGTWREGYIGKLKRFEDTEGVLIEIEEGQTNTNTDIRDNMGFAKRSFVKEGMVPSGMAGALIVNVDGKLARVAPGVLKHNERKYMLVNQSEYLGRILTFRHFPHGAKDTFRQAKFANWRGDV